MSDTFELIRHVSEKAACFIEKCRPQLLSRENFNTSVNWFFSEFRRLFYGKVFLPQLTWEYFYFYASIQREPSIETIELMVLTSMSLGCKLNGSVLPDEYVPNASNNRITSEMILNNEVLLMEKLQWELYVPTVAEFQLLLLQPLNFDKGEEVLKVSQRFAEGCYKENMISENGHLVAALASLLWAFDQLLLSQLKNDLVQVYSAEYEAEVGLAMDYFIQVKSRGL